MFKSQTSQIIITIIFLLITSIIFLFIKEANQHSYSKNKSWWSVSFVNPNPESKSLDFQIQNYDKSEKFSYFLEDKNHKTIKKEEIIIANNSKKVIKVDLNNVYYIKVLHKNKKRILYK